MARFAGKVHGVVVQIITNTFLPFRAGRYLFIFSSSTSNFTNTEGDSLSAYSTSASASAVTHEWHQWTGFLPLYTYPLLTNSANSLTIAPS